MLTAKLKVGGGIWQVGVSDNQLVWPESLGQGMVRPNVDEVRGACLTFPCPVGLGWDKMHPRAVARCSDIVIEALITLLMLAEMRGYWFSYVGVILVVLIPKSDGGKRPIGLFPSIVRIWMRLRSRVAEVVEG